MTELGYVMDLKSIAERHGGSTPPPRTYAEVAELGYALVLEASPERGVGSSPILRIAGR
jgi:hypothetical protein